MHPSVLHMPCGGHAPRISCSSCAPCIPEAASGAHQCPDLGLQLSRLNGHVTVSPLHRCRPIILAACPKFSFHSVEST